MAMTKNKKTSLRWYHVGVDSWLGLALFVLLLMGVIMVASSSVAIKADAYFYVRKQMYFIVAALSLGVVVMFISSDVMQRLSHVLLAVCFIVLLMTLVPKLGADVKGASRWIQLTEGFRFQPVEAIKLALIVVMAAYVVERQEKIQNSMWGILRPLCFILFPVGFLLICQPDYGSTVLLSVIVFAMIFMAGARIRDVLLLGIGSSSLLLTIAYAASYRLDRFQAFFAEDIWQHAAGKGYQITQALIAVGRGEFFGVGLGSGIQKLRYLPEGHNDFIFAVFAEEFGFFGVLVMISVFLLLFFRIFKVSKEAFANGNDFAGFMCAGIGFWLALQTLLNMGVNLRLLPTKGLTLPFISAGGSGILMNVLAVAVVLRISYENRSLEVQRRQVKQRESAK